MQIEKIDYQKGERSILLVLWFILGLYLWKENMGTSKIQHGFISGCKRKTQGKSVTMCDTRHVHSCCLTTILIGGLEMWWNRPRKRNRHYKENGTTRIRRRHWKGGEESILVHSQMWTLLIWRMEHKGNETFQ